MNILTGDIDVLSIKKKKAATEKKEASTRLFEETMKQSECVQDKARNLCDKLADLIKS